MLTPRDDVAYPYDTSVLLSKYIQKFHDTEKHQIVSFRDLVFWIKHGERATHYIHSYPGKILPHIVHFFLSAFSYFPDNSIVLDPFAGTGTVALEAYLSKKNSLFADSNPLARLITSSKINFIDTKLINDLALDISDYYFSNSKYNIPDVLNIDYWYDNDTIVKLSKIKDAIESIQNSLEKDFLFVTFSSVVRKVSRADPKLSVPVRSKNIGYHEKKDVIDIFKQQLMLNCRRQESFQDFGSRNMDSKCVGNDARNLKIPSLWNDIETRELADKTVDLIITSPPYAGAQKYIRATSLNIGWLGLSESSKLKDLDRMTIGRENLKKSEYDELRLTDIKSADSKLKKLYKKNPLRASIAGNYINEMKIAINEMKRVLKKDGMILFIIGNNSISGEVFKSSKYLLDYFLESGFDLELLLTDEIKSWGLMTKRNKTASIITREWIILLRKRV
jgi:16S rRNA G966 N2-methylase RsmD/SAM-dependent methyltransferase